MNKLSVGVGVVLAAMALTIGTAMAGITGSEHDFSAKSWNPGGEICEPCHIPHGADISVTDAPLWNHEVTAFGSYTVYSSATLDALGGTLAQPSGISKLCLSCHDGTVALDNFGGTTGGTNFIGGADLIGTDLSDDHPISFTFDSALATTDGGLFDPSSASSSLGGTIDADLLFNGKLECASCHDVHDAAGNADLLRIRNNDPANPSALCLTCHNK